MGLWLKTFPKMSRGVVCRFNMCIVQLFVKISWLWWLSVFKGAIGAHWVHDHPTTIKCKKNMFAFLSMPAGLWKAMDLTILMEKPSKKNIKILLTRWENSCTHTRSVSYADHLISLVCIWMHGDKWHNRKTKIKIWQVLDIILLPGNHSPFKLDTTNREAKVIN